MCDPNDTEDYSYYTKPEFIYGGPFVEMKKPTEFIDAVTPFCVNLQGTFKESFTHTALKDRLPHIITKVIDAASREGPVIKATTGAGDEDVKFFIATVVKLKNDLVTNKPYDHFKIDTEEGENWNKWIDALMHKKYFTNIWVFTECYVYRRIFEACELRGKLVDYDYFEEQKKSLLADNLDPMCYVANKVFEMFAKTEDKAARKASFVALLKLGAWANKCDRNFSCGEKVTLVGDVKEGPAIPKPLPPAPPPPPPKKGKAKPPPGPLIISPEPFQMILDLKERFVIDDTNKISDQVCNKAEAMKNKIAGITTFKYKCSCHRLAKAFGRPLCEQEAPPGEAAPEAAKAEELPKIPCPSKMVTPINVTFDIVCNNAGYELFTDMCLAAFLLDQDIVKRVRFHLKRMPWFVSDATPKDVDYLIKTIETVNHVVTPPIPTVPEGTEPPPPPAPVTSAKLNALAAKFKGYISEGKFLILAEDFWTTPIVYRDMKAKDYYMYRKLQFATAILFKGDVNYRKLLGDRKPNPYTTLESNLEGFIPAPIIASRTVKSELICGMPKGKYEVYSKANPYWMETSDYGMVQYCAKAEPLKPADRPCWDYCDTCFGIICPDHEKDL